MTIQLLPSSIRESAAVSLDSSTIVRSSAGAARVSCAALSALTLVSGVLAAVFGADLALTGAQEIVQASKNQDEEGVIAGATLTMGGAAFSAFGGTLTLSTLFSKGTLFATLLKVAAAPVIAGICATAIPIIATILYAVFLLKGLSELTYMISFREDLAKQTTPQDKITFLQGLATTATAKGKVMLERRIGPQALAKLLTPPKPDETQSTPTSTQVATPPPVPTPSTPPQIAKPVEVTDLAQLVDKESFRILVKKVLMVAVSIIGLAAAVALIASPIGAVTLVIAINILFAITGILWLLMDWSLAHQRLSDLLHSLHQRPSIVTDPLHPSST